jgi:soluble lytic murein transglycosylase-like protein
MPMIRPYEQQVTAQGQQNIRADAADFGAESGRALSNIAQAGAALNAKWQEQVEAQDVTNVHVNMAKARAEWTQNLQDRANAAIPGDDTFAPKVMEDMNAYFGKFADSVQTQRGKQVFASLSATMTTEFGDRAIGIQADLAGKDAVNKYDVLQKSYGTTVYNDQSQLNAALALGKAAIDDPAGIFAKIPSTARDKLKIQLENDLNLSAAKGFVRHNPEALLGSIAPDILQQFKPGEKLVAMNAAPGGTPNISSGAMKWAEPVAAAGAARGVNSNILLAQLDKESAGNPNAVGKKGEIGLTQFMPDTAAWYKVKADDPQSHINGQAQFMSDMLKKYGGDYTKALAAYNFGPANLDRTLARYGDGWVAKLPSSTREYVSTIMSKSGMIAAAPDANAPAEPTQVAPTTNNQPADSKLPFFKALSWKEQDQIVGEAVQLQHMKMTMQERARMEAERIKKDNQEITMDSLEKRIYAPAEGEKAPTDQEIWEDKTLSPAQKQHLSDLLIQRPRQVLERSHPEEYTRLYKQIIADGDDPTKTYNSDAIRESFRLGKISAHEYDALSQRVAQLKDPNNNNFEKQVAKISAQVHDSLSKSIQGSIDPVAANDAAYRFTFDMQKAIDAKRKANEDPRTLFDPNSRDYLLKPERINAYLQPSKTALAVSADKQVAAEKANMASFKDYDKLASGTLYTDPQGNVRKKK